MTEPKGRDRKATPFTIFESVPRPLLRWICIFAAIFALGGADLAGIAFDNTARGLVLAFILSVYGLRGLEKIKGAA